MPYYDHKHFSYEIFRAELDEELSKFDIHNIRFEQFLIFFRYPSLACA